MTSATFFELLDLHLDNATLKHPQLFGLESFCAEQLAANGYERIGDPREFHLYEKGATVRYHRRTLEVNFKCYFLDRTLVGSGFNLACGVRLGSLLKYRQRLVRAGLASPVQATWYFSEDKEQGAVILDQQHVIRFNQWQSKGAYMVCTLESDFDCTGAPGSAATRAVMQTFEPHNLERLAGDARKGRQPAAFRRLAGALQDAGIR